MSENKIDRTIIKAHDGWELVVCIESENGEKIASLVPIIAWEIETEVIYVRGGSGATKKLRAVNPITATGDEDLSNNLAVMDRKGRCFVQGDRDFEDIESLVRYWNEP